MGARLGRLFRAVDVRSLGDQPRAVPRQREAVPRRDRWPPVGSATGLDVRTLDRRDHGVATAHPFAWLRRQVGGPAALLRVPDLSRLDVVEFPGSPIRASTGLLAQVLRQLLALRAEVAGQCYAQSRDGSNEAREL